MNAPTAAAKPLTHKDLRLFVIGAMLPVFIGAMDNTILASALPTIGRDLNDMRNLPWLITVFLLASTACMPLYGKIADIHGRRPVLCVAIVIHFAGSLICALSPSMAVLIFGRIVQGIGAAGLVSIPVVVLGDVAAPRDRGKYAGYFAVVYTTAGACGPALGGFLSDHVHWSAIFWLNIPLEIIALILVTRLLRNLPRYERPHRLDLLGAALIVVASVSFMLGLNLGARYGWTSAPIVGLFAAAAVIAALFVWRLLTAPEPLIPLAVLKHPIVRWATIANACGWSAIVGLNIFLPIYLQIVVGLSPTNAGLVADRADGEPQHHGRSRRPGGGTRQALQGAADGRPAGGHHIADPAGAVGRPADAVLVPGAAAADRHGLRADADHGLGGGAERGRAPPFRHRLRHHELLAQPHQHHPDRDPGRAGAGGDLRARAGHRRTGRRTAAGQRRSRGGVPPRVLRGRHLHVHFLRRSCYDRATAAAGRAIGLTFWLKLLEGTMANFTPLSAAIGGALIGLASLLLMLLVGRVAGISGIAAGILGVGALDRGWRLAFIAGLILAPIAAMLAGYAVPVPTMPASWFIVITAGFLVGFGARLGGGCTSGHGICGIARLSKRSIAATMIFMGAAVVTVALMRHVIGG